MDNFSPQERLKLDEMIKAYNTEDTTSKIRELKHSQKIREDVGRMEALKRQYNRMKQNEPKKFRSICETRCSFLYSSYTQLFNKLIKDHLDLRILSQFLHILSQIEDGSIDQHVASYQVGSILKQLYIDSAMRAEQDANKRQSREDRRKEKKSGNPLSNAVLSDSTQSFNTREFKNISWAQFKKSNPDI